MARTERAPAVAHVVECYLGLTETFIHEYLTAFSRVRPVVIARRLENLEAFPLPPSATLHVSPPRRGSAAWARTAVRRKLRGGEPHLEEILSSEDVRILHAHFGPTACTLAALGTRVRQPLVTSFYGYDASMTQVVEEFRDAYRRLFDRGEVFLVEGTAMKGKLEAIGCPPAKLRIQRIGIDTGRYRFRAREDPGDGPLVLLQCGRMVPKKGFSVTLRALSEARRRDPRLQLRIIGDGPERPSIERGIGELGLDEAVTLLGSCPRTVFLEELDRAHLYVQPSVTGPDGDSEGGAPTTLLEAQATGAPVLASRHADIPEVVLEGKSAMLSDENDPDGLAANMIEMASHPERWPPMGQAGREHVESQHDVRRLAARLEQLYGQLLSDGEGVRCR
jgi:colanic acid/amylovoran biosynthesis glycosyltransferase